MIAPADSPVRLLLGDCLEVMPTLEAESVDSIVTDPPYGLAFMGKDWDHGVPGVHFWQEALRVAKPGAHLLAFGGTRTYHRLACAIEDAGWEIRDCVMWVYGSGFPKSLDVSKAIDNRGGSPGLSFQIGAAIKSARQARGLSVSECDRMFCGETTNWSWFEGRPAGQRAPTPGTFAKIVAAWPELASLAEAVAEAEREVVGRSENGIAGGTGKHAGQDAAYGFAKEFNITVPATDAARQWQGWGTALKPAWEPIIVARKPLVGTVAANVLAHGTGALNIDGCRVEHDEECRMMAPSQANIDNPSEKHRQAGRRTAVLELKPAGRWPANLIHDGSEDVVGLFPVTTNKGHTPASRGAGGISCNGHSGQAAVQEQWHDTGSAARFFYCAKASKADRGDGNHHPTVKPTDLMRYLCRLVTPPDGVILDPFMGSGSTGKAALLEGFRFIGIEQSAEYFEIAEKRICNERSKMALLGATPKVVQRSFLEPEECGSQ